VNPVVAGLVVLAAVFGAALLGLRIRAIYPKHHLGSPTEATVKLAIGLISMMAALMLGLLVSSAKAKYDVQKSEVTALSAKIVVLDRMLAAYGPESSEARVQLRNAVEQMIAHVWPRTDTDRSQLDPSAASGAAVLDAVLALSPGDDSQSAIKRSLLPMTVDLGQMRWLLYAQTNYGLPLPMLVMLVTWLAVIFFSYGLFADPNGTVMAILFVAALAVSGAIFVITALDQPFAGLMRIGSTPMDVALAHLGG